MNKSIYITIFLLALIVPPCSLVFALEGQVVGVADGDTITVLDQNKHQHKIRLYGIDCPESSQPFGKAAKKLTSKLTYNKTASVKSYDTDRYGRTVGVVTVEGVNVNLSLIQNGLAWQYRKYCKDSFCQDWITYEKNAKVSRLGLWGGHDPIPPWEWRKGVRNSSYSESSPGKYFANSSILHGNTSSHVFHKATCRYFNCKKCTTIFNNRDSAINAGFRPCKQCNP
jgi:endonuclease YncB( thermonuclease family)